MPKVTVLMPVYNGDRFLREAIESILNQTFEEFEFLIINDGSIDNTREIILSYDDPRIRLVDNNCNLGLIRSLNKGLELAEGQFIARQDADDISEPERLAQQVAFLETHPEVALVGTWYKEIDSQGKLIGECKLPCDCTQIRWELLFYCTFAHPSVMLQKSTIIKQIGFYSKAALHTEDYELWCRIARCFPVANLDKHLVRYRIHANSVTGIHGEKMGYGISVTNVGNVLDWDTTDVANNEVLFNRMSVLLFGYQYGLKDISLHELNNTIENIFRLHKPFCQYYSLSQTDCRSHRTMLCNRISNQLIQLAHSYFHQDNYAAWRLFVQAYRLHWPILFKKSYIRLALKLLVGSRLVRSIKYIRNQQVSQFGEISK